MVRELRGLMEEERALTVPILDTLANMNLPAELLEDVQTTVLRSLRSVEVADLPVVVRFLLRSITKSNVDKVHPLAIPPPPTQSVGLPRRVLIFIPPINLLARSRTHAQVVRKLRRHLDFGGPSAANTGEAMTLGTPPPIDWGWLGWAKRVAARVPNHPNYPPHPTLILFSSIATSVSRGADSLRSGVRFQKDVTKAFLKEIQVRISTAPILTSDLGHHLFICSQP